MPDKNNSMNEQKMNNQPKTAQESPQSESPKIETPPQSTESKPPKSNKNMKMGIVGILVLIIVGSLGYYFFLSSAGQELRLLRKYSIEWKLYESNSNLITFKYPDGWTLKEDFDRLEEGLWNINIFRKNNPQDITGIGIASGFYAGENLEAYVEQEAARLIEDGKSSVGDIKAISIDGKAGFAYDFHIFFEDTDLTLTGTNSYFADNVGYVISYGLQSTSGANPDEMAAIYNQIIASIETPDNAIVPEEDQEPEE